MIAGTLEIQLLAGIARLQKDMQEAQRIVGGAMSNIEGAVGGLRKAFGALGITLGVGAFVAMIKGSVDAQDALRDLSKTTNISVEDLAGLQFAAKQSGTEITSLATSINKMSQNIGKDGEKFRALGITAKDPLEAFKQLSDIFVAIEDPQLRAAVMAQALGKSWQGAASLLSEGSAKIQEMVDKGKLLSGITKESADEADQFNDTMVELNTTMQGLLTKALIPGVSRWNETAKAMKDTHTEGELLLTVYRGLQVFLTGSDRTKNDKELFELTGRQLDLENRLMRLRAAPPMFSGASAVRQVERELADVNARLKTTLAFRKALGASGEITPPPPPLADGIDEKALETVIKEARARQFLNDKDSYAARVAAIKGFSKTFADEIKTQGTLLDLAYKEAGIQNQRTQEELILAQSALKEKELRQQLDAQIKLRDLALKQGPTGAKDAEAAAAHIAQINAAIVANEVITQAQIRAERTITLQRQLSEYQQWLDARISMGQSIAESLVSETERENLEYAKRLENLELFLQSQQDAVNNAQELRETLDMQHKIRLMQIQMNKEQHIRDMEANTFSLAAGLLQKFAGESKAAALAVIAINKGLAIAQTIMATQVAVMRAFADLGPIAGAPVAAAMEHLGAISVGLIAATGLVEAHGVMTGGGTAGVGTGGAGAQPVFNANPVTGQPASNPRGGQTTVYHLHGKSFDRDQVRDLLEMQNENSVDGGRTIVVEH